MRGPIDQDVERPLARQPIAGERLDRSWIDEIESADGNPLDPGDRRRSVVRVARADRDRRAGPAQRAGHLEADTGMATNYDDVATS